MHGPGLAAESYGARTQSHCSGRVQVAVQGTVIMNDLGLGVVRLNEFGAFALCCSMRSKIASVQCKCEGEGSSLDLNRLRRTR